MDVVTKEETRKRAACERVRLWRINNPERFQATLAAYVSKNRDAIAARKARWAERNADRLKAKQRAYYAVNKQKLVERAAEWARTNRARYEANQAAYRKRESERRCIDVQKRRANQLRAIPSWANEFFIAEAYRLARMRTKAT